jgi:hypothetical protein
MSQRGMEKEEDQFLTCFSLPLLSGRDRAVGLVDRERQDDFGEGSGTSGAPVEGAV